MIDHETFLLDYRSPPDDHQTNDIGQIEKNKVARLTLCN